MRHAQLKAYFSVNDFESKQWQWQKGGRRQAWLTAYDYPTARLAGQAGLDALLVGDSLGMVVLGFEDTTQVTIEMMEHHVAAVARAQPAIPIIGDLPIHSYDTEDQALASARRLVAAGADAVKLEGGMRQLVKVRAIVEAGIPFVGHLGMLPQRVREEGGYRKKGKSPAEAEALMAAALALAHAGAKAIVLESVVPNVAAQITRALDIVTIGVGSGEGSCDGEIAVISDVVGSFPWFVPPFAKVEGKVALEIEQAIARYVARVRTPRA